MRAKVQKWGNSLAVRIPRGFAEQLGVSHDSEVELLLTPKGLIVKPVAHRYALSDLLAKVTEENLHGEISTGGKVGREEW